MSEIIGKLVQQGKKIMVELPTRNGSAKFSIPEAAKLFRDADFEDGIEANVERDDKNRIIKVTIPGKAEVAPKVTTKAPKKSWQGDQKKSKQPIGKSVNRAVKDRPKASPKILGEAFHNPYTFIPFGENPIRERTPPSLASVDETVEGYDRFTGVIQLKVETLSPLLSCHPTAVNAKDPKNDHKIYQALTIGDDVIVPATGIRGAIRTLMTILTSGTLGYLDRTAYLIQGRDAKLGPRGNAGTRDVPEKVFLGEVIKPGNANYQGQIRLGETRLVKLRDLERLDLRLDRSPSAKPVWLQLDENDVPVKHSTQRSSETPWRLRLSGRPVGGRRIEERKSEAVFRPAASEVSIPAKLWAAYTGRHAFGNRPYLRPQDLVWLEPNDPDREINTADDIRSLQWARWGKRGQELKQMIPDQFHPDSWNAKGLVDEVTDLFGQVADKGLPKDVKSFAGRIQPENLVFKDARSQCQRTTLAPLAPPHPGCLGFYRNNDDPDKVDFKDMLRGYKVYRTTNEEGSDGPWNYAVQGVYDKGTLRPPQQKVNKTVDLLPANITGSLSIAFRALDKRELSLLIQVCSVPWRIGGGKPLGLGRCHVSITRICDEFGHEINLDQWLGGDWESKVDDIKERVEMWVASQRPVARLRYPRAVRGNSRGGHAWFQSHAKPRMVSAPDIGEREGGLAPIYIDGELLTLAKQKGETVDAQEPMISGQTLPLFDHQQPDADLLYGYDMLGIFDSSNRNTFTKFEKFDEKQHDMSGNPSYGNQGKNKAFREQQKDDRRT